MCVDAKSNFLENKHILCWTLKLSAFQDILIWNILGPGGVEGEHHPLLILKLWGSKPALSENTTPLPWNIRLPQEPSAPQDLWIEWRQGEPKKKKRKRILEKLYKNLNLRKALSALNMDLKRNDCFLTPPHSEIHKFGKSIKPGLEIQPVFAKQRFWVCRTFEFLDRSRNFQKILLLRRQRLEFSHQIFASSLSIPWFPLKEIPL